MRTNKEQIKNFLHGIFFGVFVVGIMFVTTGCPDKSKKNNGYYRDGYYRGGYRYGDRGYGGNGYVEYIGIGMSQNGAAELTLEATVEGQSTMGNTSTYITGELFIDSPIQCMNFMGWYLEPGRYDIEPASPAPMITSGLGASVPQATLYGYGYDDIQIGLRNAFFFRNELGSYDGLQAQVDIYLGNTYCTSLVVSYQYL